LLGLDKKRKGRRVKFVLVRQPGQIEFRNLELSELTRLAGDLGRSD
jgi:3-dehydroquinate synthetase